MWDIWTMAFPCIPLLSLSLKNHFWSFQNIFHSFSCSRFFKRFSPILTTRTRPFLLPFKVFLKSSPLSPTLIPLLNLHIFTPRFLPTHSICFFPSFLHKELESQLELSSTHTESDAPAGKEKSPLCCHNRGTTSNGKHHHRLPGLQRETERGREKWKDVVVINCALAQTCLC